MELRKRLGGLYADEEFTVWLIAGAGGIKKLCGWFAAGISGEMANGSSLV